MSRCICCECFVPESIPQFTHHVHNVDKPNGVPISLINYLSFPVAFLHVIHEYDNGFESQNEPEIIYVCSHNCFLLMENYKQNQSGDRPNKKARLN